MLPTNDEDKTCKNCFYFQSYLDEDGNKKFYCKNMLSPNLYNNVTENFSCVSFYSIVEFNNKMIAGIKKHNNSCYLCNSCFIDSIRRIYKCVHKGSARYNNDVDPYSTCDLNSNNDQLEKNHINDSEFTQICNHCLFCWLLINTNNDETFICKNKNSKKFLSVVAQDSTCDGFYDLEDFNNPFVVLTKKLTKEK